MSLSSVLSAVGDIIAYLVGGTVGATTITFADSWVGSILSVFTASNGLLLVPVILSISLFGIHVLKSLMGR